MQSKTPSNGCDVRALSAKNRGRHVCLRRKKGKMCMKSLILGVILALTATIAGADEPSSRTISVVGEGLVAVEPDMAVISLGVTHTDVSAKVAMDRVSEDARALLGQLTALGVDARDVQTDRLSVQPLWDHNDGARRVTGYVAQNAVSVRVRDLAALSAILDAALRAGSNDFNGLQFTLQDNSEQLAMARAAAVRDAMARARQLADAAEITLGAIRTMTEQGGAARPEMFAAARSGDVPIAAGELTVSARVAITFDIQP